MYIFYFPLHSTRLTLLPNIFLQNDEQTKSKHEVDDIAAGAESIQPKGNTLETTTVSTKIPFLLKHSLREYQHIGLDWLVAMYTKKLNGILAVSIYHHDLLNQFLLGY